MNQDIFNLIMNINVLYYVEIEDLDPASAVKKSLMNAKKAYAMVYDARNRRRNRERY